jgi:hypothetical protein
VTELQYSTVISPNDHMWITGPQWYLEIGTSALDCINSALATAHNTPTSILDLPCGHGRVCRMLRASFPDAHLTVCDLDHDAVDFCAAQFNATPVYSDEDIRRVSLDQCFEPDLVRIAVHAPGSSEMAGFPWLFYRASVAGWGARPLRWKDGFCQRRNRRDSLPDGNHRAALANSCLSRISKLG